jgi:hypothetical protein
MQKKRLSRRKRVVSRLELISLRARIFMKKPRENGIPEARR